MTISFCSFILKRYPQQLTISAMTCHVGKLQLVDPSHNCTMQTHMIEQIWAAACNWLILLTLYVYARPVMYIGRRYHVSLSGPHKKLLTSHGDKGKHIHVMSTLSHTPQTENDSHLYTHMHVRIYVHTHIPHTEHVTLTHPCTHALAQTDRQIYKQTRPQLCWASLFTRIDKYVHLGLGKLLSNHVAVKN